jgi:hypothetical protein
MSHEQIVPEYVDTETTNKDIFYDLEYNFTIDAILDDIYDFINIQSHQVPQVSQVPEVPEVPQIDMYNTESEYSDDDYDEY